jgi:hypothetical protein
MEEYYMRILEELFLRLRTPASRMAVVKKVEFPVAREESK